MWIFFTEVTNLSTPPPNFTESLKIGFLETLKETPGTYPPLAVGPCAALLNYFSACFLSAVLHHLIFQTSESANV